MINRRHKNNRGAALLVVLFIVMAITVLALGFLSRSDIELACGQNMALRTAMDYLAESGLQHARGLILNPQDANSEYWTGDAKQQLVSGSNDYYDVVVTPDPCSFCNYQITTEAYREKGTDKIGRSTLTAQLRLDPAVAYCCNTNTTISQRVKITGDVNCAGNLTNIGTINGDVFANSLTGSISGQFKSPADLSLGWPRVTIADFTTRYPIQTINDAVLGNIVLCGATKVFYRSGNLLLTGDVQVNGMLIVSGDLTVTGSGNAITSVKNLPAILVGGNIYMGSGGKLDVSGLAVVNGQVVVNMAATGLNVTGGLFVSTGITETTTDSSGNGNTATLYNGPILQPAGGKVGGAFQFDGVDDYVQTPNSSSKLQITGNYTLGVWIKPDATQKAWAGIISKCSTDGSINHYTLQFDSSSPKRLVIYHPGDSWDTGITLTDIANDWHHIKVVRNGNQMTSYIDGIPRRLNIVWNVSPGSGNGHLNIGVDRTATSNYVYQGLIDDVRIYSEASVDGFTYPANPLGHWNFDDGGGNVSINAAPPKTAIVTWSQSGVAQEWGQAAGAFFRSIKRQ